MCLEKMCTKCKLILPTSEFHKGKRVYQCKNCKKQIRLDNLENCLENERAASARRLALHSDEINAQARARRAKDPEGARERNRAYRLKNIEKLHARGVEIWTNRDEEKCSEDKRAYYMANREHLLLKSAQRYNSLKNNEEFQAKNSATARARQARIIKALPSWADLKAIEAIYVECRALSLRTGILHHVDHTIPLRGKKVSGLHVETNLRIITAAENMAKGNRYTIE